MTSAPGTQISGIVVRLCVFVLGASVPFFAGGASSEYTRVTEWPAYAGNNASTKYSKLDQINSANVSRLRIAWRWKSIDSGILAKHPELTTWKFEATPIMAGGVLYTSTSLSQVAAIDAATGRMIWSYDPHAYAAGIPPNFGFAHRGIAYWKDGQKARIFIGTGDAYLIALDATTGRPVSEFGKNGRIDLTQGLRRPIDRLLYGLTSPPIVCSNTVIVGSSILDYPRVKLMPPGDVRGFDVRSGRLRWTFHTIPMGGEYGWKTWLNESWKEIGAANVWAPMSADDRLGYIYLPVSTPASDYYGGRRPGDGIFGESLVCLDASTGKRVWYFQLVHHGLWDYDPPAAPILTEVQAGKGIIKAVAQVSKQGFVYVFNRVSGQPIWPIVERPVPQSGVPGEHSSPTQPVPSRPVAFDRQGLSPNDLIDFTPALHQEAEAILRHFDYGPLFAPPTERGVTIMPGPRGGASWSGAAYDPESNFLYIPSVTAPTLVRLVKQFWFQFPERYRAFESNLIGPRGLPITKPPYGRVTAIDLNTGDRVWTEPMGNGPRNHPALRSLNPGRLGWPYRGFPLVTKTLLFIAQEGSTRAIHLRPNGTDAEFDPVEPGIQVFDKCSGKLLTEIGIPSNASGSPLTYLDHGTQYIVLAIGGGNIPAELIALTLPR